jgi:predicted RNase H-like HicB family nuclease
VGRSPTEIFLLWPPFGVAKLHAPVGHTEGVDLTIELDREVDGRWIADVPELNILVYGDTRKAAIEAAEQAAREIIADRIARGTLTAT